jgi:ABC-type Fe3+-siderophore transport system permease subunit
MIYLNTTWCAGCLGLLRGCVLSIVLMMLYVVVSFQQPPTISRLMLFFGLLVIALVYLEIIRGSRHSIIHVLFNGMLILSFFFITISIVELSGKVEYGLYAILFCILWLDTRIQLSRWHHRRLCSSCPETCKIYESTTIFGR